MNEEGNFGYYNDDQADPGGMRYRLEGDDVISAVVSSLRGGLVEDSKTGKVRFNRHYRLMNEEGVARVELFLRSGVNKINHLTKYKNEERVMRQMRSLCKSFLIELVENLKRWAPSARTDNGVLINPTYDKVRNKHLVLQLVENALFQSMQRGQEGFEAELTGKHFVVTENVGRENERSERGGAVRNLFNWRRRGGVEYD